MENLQGISLKQAEEDGKIESRANPNHDPKTGRFTSGAGGSKKKKTKYSPTYSGKKVVGVKMSQKKYMLLSDKVATAHPEWTSGIHVFHDANYGYKLEAHNFGDYTFQTKWRLK